MIQDKSDNLVLRLKQYLFKQMEASKAQLHFFEKTTEHGLTIWGLQLTLRVKPNCSKRNNSPQRKVGLERADLLLG